MTSLSTTSQLLVPLANDRLLVVLCELCLCGDLVTQLVGQRGDAEQHRLFLGADTLFFHL